MRITSERAFWEYVEPKGQLDPVLSQFKPSDKPPRTFPANPQDDRAVIQVICGTCAPRMPLTALGRISTTPTFTAVWLQRQKFVTENRFKRSNGTKVETRQFKDAYLGQCDRCGQLWMGLIED